MQFNYQKETITYKNPWYDVKRDFISKKEFDRRNPEVFKKGAGMVIRVHDKQFDYLVNGQVFTQRAGCTGGEKLLDFLIENYEKIKNMNTSDFYTFSFNEFQQKNK